MARTIVSKGNGRRSEKTSTAPQVRPGMLLELTSADVVQAHSVAYSGATVLTEPMVAVENSLFGAEVSTLYAASSVVQIYHAQKGDELYMLLEDGENVSIGEELEPNGTNGTLVTNVTANPPMVVALEALDLSISTNLTDELILVRVL